MKHNLGTEKITNAFSDAVASIAALGFIVVEIRRLKKLSGQ